MSGTAVAAHCMPSVTLVVNSNKTSHCCDCQ
jgi:hypothetical protein